MDIKYIHGSGDSTDVDVIYVVDKLPSLQECKRFCSDKEENRNICVIKNGIVTECYKGTPDEVNNAVYLTYGLHEQSFPLLINRLVHRDVTAKCMRAVRIILSHLSRSQYRTEVKAALIGDWETRLNTLQKIDLTTIDFSTLNKNMTREDILKTIAFQIGQCFLLMNGLEFYTKADIAENSFVLTQFLYRWTDNRITDLESCKNELIEKIKKRIKVDKNNPFYITDEITSWDIKEEKQISKIDTSSKWDKLYNFMMFLSKRPNFSTVEMEQDLYDFCMLYTPGFIDDNGIIWFNGNKYFLG